MGSLDTFFFRVVGGIVLAALPVGASILVVLFLVTAQNYTVSAQAQAQVVATAASAQVSTWLADRKGQLRDVAAAARDQLGDVNLTSHLQGEIGSENVIQAMAVADTKGAVVAQAGDPTYFIGLGTQAWFTGALTAETVQPVVKLGDRLAWLASVPIISADGNSQGVVVADLKVSQLGSLLEPYGPKSLAGASHEIHILDDTHHLVYTSDWFAIADDRSLAVQGALRLVPEGALADQALSHGGGSARITDYRHHDVLAGYFPVPGLRWVVVASTDASAALAPVYALGQLTVALAVIGSALLIAGAVLVTRQMLKPIRSLSQLAARVEAGDLSGRLQPQGGAEMRLLGTTFNSMLERMSAVLSRLRGEVTESATALAAAADHLATAAEEQTTAVTATSGSMTRLELASASIAGDMDRVARHAAEMRTNIETAQADLHVSSERANTLMQRVADVDHILATIGDVADQTNLLALNAAIEAARAGDAGRGFAVVADEVRRLAERSKAASSDITKLLQGTQIDTNLTVKALQRRSEQMEEWLQLTASMTEVSGQVQVATQEQRSSTQMAVGAIDNIVESSRSVEGTARQLAEAAARQGRLAKDLAGTGWEPDEEA